MPAAAAVNHQQGHAAAGRLVFDAAALGFDQHAAVNGAGGGQLQVLIEVPADKDAGDQNGHDHHDRHRREWAARNHQQTQIAVSLLRTHGSLQ